jgi:hypothetical protein
MATYIGLITFEKPGGAMILFGLLFMRFAKFYYSSDRQALTRALSEELSG